MLINDLKYFESKSNYHNKFSGMDTPGKSASRREFEEYPIQDFDYQFNSWGFRGPDYEQYIGKPVNICLGDSFTVNLGGPIEHSWCSQLTEHFDIPTVNLGMDGAGNDAASLVYSRACEVFDVQNTFVMYSYLHRRLVNNIFRQDVYKDKENFDYFLEQRIPNAIECALPGWNWTDEEKQFLSNQGIYVPWVLYFSDHQTMDRRFIVKESYNNLRGPDWPTLEQFIQGAEPHADMFTKQFGQFVSYRVYTNRDGHHMNYNANKIYADYLYTQWRKNNES
jgi:hypothetical protein